MSDQKFTVEHFLNNLGIDELNEMQLASSDAFKNNTDLILLSNTGSGKTLAFLIPLVLQIDIDKKGTQALIVVPSRELALQIEDVYKKMGTGLKITSCYGGHKREIEENNLVEAPTVIVGTPGRLGDHIRRENINTQTITTLVLDEYDKSLELGFQEELQFIIQSIPSVEKRVLTSATEAKEVPAFVGLNNPVTLNFLTGTKPNLLDIKILHSEENDKTEALFKLLCFLGNRSSIIFCNHRESVERTSTYLSDKGITNVYYHGALEQRERENAISKFRNGTANFMVTTDLAARGLDIANIRYIIHYHLPPDEQSFTHRNGRTARMEASGTSILIIGPEEKVPAYITGETTVLDISENGPIPEKPKWTTIFIAAGKKDKVNKIDIVGFLTNRGQLKKEDIGLIDVKDFSSFVAVRKSKVGSMLQNIKEQKIKNKKVKIEVAK